MIIDLKMSFKIGITASTLLCAGVLFAQEIGAKANRNDQPTPPWLPASVPDQAQPLAHLRLPRLQPLEQADGAEGRTTDKLRNGIKLGLFGQTDAETPQAFADPQAGVIPRIEWRFGAGVDNPHDTGWQLRAFFGKLKHAETAHLLNQHPKRFDEPERPSVRLNFAFKRQF